MVHPPCYSLYSLLCHAWGCHNNLFHATQTYPSKKIDKNLDLLMDNLVYLGLAFLLLGMLMGALWAKEAWGHYWSWDPKETWAFITSCGYLLYIHLCIRNKYPKLTLWLLSFSFILLMITWVGVNYLPAAQGSVHVYS
nr:cytochrome c biogenesis protein CcsA [Bacteroides propionicifaciens]